MGKKRKPELDLDHEQNMHGSFVAAANSLSQLYTKAVQQHKRAHTNGARHVLERQIQWVLRDYASNSVESIPTNVLLKFLQQEVENADLWAHTPSPMVSAHAAFASAPQPQSSDDSMSEGRHGRHAGSRAFSSSPSRSFWASGNHQNAAQQPFQPAETSQGFSGGLAGPSSSNFHQG
ncbi:hypothetical protein WJX74_002030 [Apatococcus lobatus]|uniref:Uncharacterized protein n=1 Tax=Apatococcus lobatus TaxID=904363 RepID=A0AAW1SAE8_9CHLO